MSEVDPPYWTSVGFNDVKFNSLELVWLRLVWRLLHSILINNPRSQSDVRKSVKCNLNACCTEVFYLFDIESTQLAKFDYVNAHK